MKVLVTGGAGYIGSACVQEWVEQGHQVTVVDNLSKGHRAAVHPDAQFIKACLSQAERIESILRQEKPEIVTHFAASALVNESMERPGRYFENNVANGLNLLEACVRSGVRKIVFSSTCSVYGIPDQLPITESAPLNPINPYGESKLLFERILRWYREVHGLHFVSFRYFNACGATDRYGEDHQPETHLIPNLLNVVLGQSDRCEVYGTDYPTPDGTCVRDYIHVKDLASSHVLAGLSDLEGVHNLGTGKGHSVLEILAACETVTGTKIASRKRPRRPGDPPELVAAPSAALADQNWQPTFTNIERIVETAWLWHKNHPKGYDDRP